MDIEKAKEVLNRINDAKRFDGIYTSIGIIFEAIEVLLNQLDKKDKIINEMADAIFLMNGDRGCTKQEKIDYFTKKVEGK